MPLTKQGDSPQFQYTPPNRKYTSKSYLMACPLCSELKRGRHARMCKNCLFASRRGPIDNKIYIIDGQRCRKIALSRKLYAIVDENLYDYLSQWRWAASGSDGKFYPNSGSQKLKFKMHHVVLGISPQEECDHINGNSLDNRVSNLRKCTRTQNMANIKVGKNNNSGYKGVSWDSHKRKWLAQITIEHKHIHIGRFTTPEAAAIARDKVAQKYLGNFAYINLPNDLQ